MESNWKFGPGAGKKPLDPFLFEVEATGGEAGAEEEEHPHLSTPPAEPERGYICDDGICQAKPCKDLKPSRIRLSGRNWFCTFSKKIRLWRQARSRRGHPGGEGTDPAEIFIQVEVENGRLLFWKITREEVSPVEGNGIPENCRVVSFTREDYRILAKKGVSIQKAKSLACRETASLEKMRVVNLSRRLGIIYATGIGRLRQVPFQLVPGMACLDQLMKERGDALPVAAGFHLGHPEGTRLLLVHAVKPDTNVAEMLVSINPVNQEEILKKFTTRHKLQDIRIYDSVALLVHAAVLPAYPDRAEWNGIDSALISRYAGVAAGMASLLSLVWAVVFFVRIHVMHTSNLTLQRAINQEKERIGKQIAEHPAAFARKVSLLETGIFRRAQVLWRPGSTVSVKATLDLSVYTVSLPLVNPTLFEPGRPSAFPVSSPGEITSVLMLKPPAGCEKSGLLTTGDMNEIDLQFHCTAPHSVLDSLVGS